MVIAEMFILSVNNLATVESLSCYMINWLALHFDKQTYLSSSVARYNNNNQPESVFSSCNLAPPPV